MPARIKTHVQFTAAQQKDLDALTKPLMQWLNDNCEPRVLAVVTSEVAAVMKSIATITLSGDE